MELQHPFDMFAKMFPQNPPGIPSDKTQVYWWHGTGFESPPRSWIGKYRKKGFLKKVIDYTFRCRDCRLFVSGTEDKKNFEGGIDVGGIKKGDTMYYISAVGLCPSCFVRTIGNTSAGISKMLAEYLNLLQADGWNEQAMGAHRGKKIDAFWIQRT
mgnify:CR=1 FL=1